MIQLSKATELAKQGHKFVVLYGKGGVGKTTFALTNPEKPKTLIISTEDDGGLSAINSIDPWITENIYAHKLDMSNGSPIGILYQFIKDLISNLQGIEVVVIDPFTNIRMMQAGFLQRTVYGGKANIQMWTELKNQINLLFEVIIELKQHVDVIIIAHEDMSTKEDSTGNNFVVIQPAVGNGPVELMEQYADEIVRIHKDGKGNRVFDFGSYGNVFGKTRLFGRESIAELKKENLTINELLSQKGEK